ncbi:MAG: hypothetical protein HQL12_00395 [Candidatus Omnitrophica bacterium]|nr:hypothetical protein [Candidatus Omnitrophota bacterium]
MAWCLLFSVFFLSIPLVFAQDSKQFSSDSGVLVSPPAQAQVSVQGSTVNNAGSGASDLSDQGNSDNPGPHSPLQPDGDSGNIPKDDIVVKGTNAVIFQMTANLKLTQDQINAVRPIVADNIANVRNLQQKLEDGAINGKTMYNQREQLTIDEFRKLSTILTPDQMKVWISIQSQ